MLSRRSEREALLAGDVAELYALGANGYLMMGFARHELFGLTLARFSERIRQADR